MKRLDILVSYIDENKIVADVGADHGITSIKVYEEKNPKKVIATDISANSLQKLRDKLENNNYNIETIVTDGIYALNQEVNQIIISGMGGFLIAEILERGIEVAKNAEKLILQPNNSQTHLRKWLHDNNFEIIDENICKEEGYFYNIIVAKFRKNELVEKYSKEEFYKYGKSNILNKDEITKEIIEIEIQDLKDVYTRIEKINTDKTNKRKSEILGEIKILEGLLCKFEK